MNRLRVATMASCVAVVGADQALAQPTVRPMWAFENHSYYNSLFAEPRAAQSTVLFPTRADSFPFAVEDRRGLIWDISVGNEFPIVGYSRQRGLEDPPLGVPPGGFAFGVWFPLSFHVVEDLGKDPSNPILNTDYRFGGQVKAQWGLARDRAFWSSARVGVKFQIGHESTHIGDEFTLGALRVHPDEFIRVNVSSNYWELAGSFEPNLGADDRYQLKVRAGDIRLLKPDKGWYSRTVLQPYGLFIAGSERNHEPYLQFEVYRQPEGRFGLIASVDLRNRTVFQYVLAPDENQTNASEPTEWSMNLIGGVRQIRRGPGLLGRITPTYYLRFYQGVNPNGQFRSQAGFSELGFGIHFGF
jgi:hypothetical protein